VGDIAEVSLNRRKLGHRLGEPYLFEISDVLEEGKNVLRVEVTRGIGNLLPYGYTDQLVEEPADMAFYLNQGS